MNWLSIVKMVLAIAIVGLSLVAAVWYLPIRLNPQGGEAAMVAHAQSDLLAARNATRTSMVALVAAFGAFVTLAYTSRTFRLNQAGQIADRYTKAVDQIGSASPAVRVGGLYALEQISKESPADRIAILDVLTAFVRTAKRENEELPWDIRTALEVITRRKLHKNEHSIDLSGTNLSGAKMRRAHLVKANLSRCQLKDVYLTGADLRRANFSGATLTRSMLCDTNLLGANFEGAVFTQVDITAAKLDLAQLSNVQQRQTEGLDKIKQQKPR